MTWSETSDAATAVTVADLVERRVSLRWHEAVAIVLEVADVFQRSHGRVVPSREHMALTPDGTVVLSGSARDAGEPVTVLADTLGALLPLLPKEAPTQLQLIASTAGPNSVSYKSVDEFTEALGYFERPGRHRIVAEVYRRAQETPSDAWRQPAHGGGSRVATGTPIRMIPTREIASHEDIDTGEIRQLVESVRQFGVLQPLVVRPFGREYELVAGAKRFAAAQIAGLDEVPCRVTEASAPRGAYAGDRPSLDTRRDAGSPRATSSSIEPQHSPDVILGPALGEIADSLRAATSCWRLSVEGPDRPYLRTVNEVTRAELQHATWLVEALQLLTQRTVVSRHRVNVGTMLEQVFRATEPERRLADVKLAANLAEASVVIRGDERLLVMAVGGALQALVALVTEVTPATVQCEVSTQSGGVLLELSQDAVSVPPSLLERFFDETWHGRPGGYGAAVALAAARKAFDLHGGSATVDSDGQGCRLTLSLPT